MFDVLYVPVTDQSPVVRLLRTTNRLVADDACAAFVENDEHGGPEFTYQVRPVDLNAETGQPVDGVPPGRPACPELVDGTTCGSVRLTWTPGETFRCRSCGGELTGADTAWSTS